MDDPYNAHFAAHQTSLDTHQSHLEAHMHAHEQAMHSHAHRTHASSDTDYAHTRSGFSRTGNASVQFIPRPPPRGTVLSLVYSPHVPGFPMQYALPAALQEPQNTYLRTVEDLNTFIGRANAVIRSAMPPSWLRPALLCMIALCFVGFVAFSILTVGTMDQGFIVGIVVCFLLFGFVAMFLPVMLGKYFNAEFNESLRDFLARENGRFASPRGFHWEPGLEVNHPSLIMQSHFMFSIHLIQHQQSATLPPPPPPSVSTSLNPAFAPSAPEFVPAAEAVLVPASPTKQNPPVVVARAYFP